MVSGVGWRIWVGMEWSVGLEGEREGGGGK